jgi:hypothetical protein
MTGTAGTAVEITSRRLLAAAMAEGRACLVAAVIMAGIEPVWTDRRDGLFDPELKAAAALFSRIVDAQPPSGIGI